MLWALEGCDAFYVSKRIRALYSNSIASVMRKHSVVPQVIPTAPDGLLTVRY